MFTEKMLRKSTVLPNADLAPIPDKPCYWQDFLGALLLIVFLSLAQGLCAMEQRQVAAPGLLSDADPEQGELVLRSDDGQRLLAPLLETAVDIDVVGMLARVKVVQRFHNPSQQWLEGKYQFPLPEHAAVDHMVMEVGERRIIGEIKEKQAAKKAYEKAKSAGQRASLVSQQRPNLFTNRIANIGPGETIVVEIHYVETLRYDQGEFSLRFPTTMTPRYSPGETVQARQATEANERTLEESVKQTAWQGGWQLDTIAASDASDIHPPMIASQNAAPLRLNARISAGFPLQRIQSLYHPIDISQNDGHYTVQLLDESIAMNRDIVLRWQPVAQQAPEAALFQETVGDWDYQLLMLLPTTQVENNEVLPREVIFVIDTSGSMSGVSLRQAQSALQYGLHQLRRQDRFNVIEFNNQARAFFNGAQAAEMNNLQQASHSLSQLNADGGTNISAALDLALRGSAPTGYVRQIVFITDGSVGNEEALFKQITQQLGDNRLFTVGIGSAPNSHFMREAAQAGRGSFTHIGDIKDVSETMSRLFSKLQRPVLTDLQLDWGNADVEVFPNKAPDLYEGEPLLLFSRSPAGLLNNDVRVTGTVLSNGEQAYWQRQLSLQHAKAQSGVAKQWARAKIQHTLSPSSQRTAEEKKQTVLELALEHQLLSRYTSFVAIEKTPSRPLDQPLQSGSVRNAMPAGNTMAMPHGATPSLSYIVFGLLSLVLAYLCSVVPLRRSSYIPEAVPEQTSQSAQNQRQQTVVDHAH